MKTLINLSLNLARVIFAILLVVGSSILIVMGINMLKSLSDSAIPNSIAYTLTLIAIGVAFIAAGIATIKLTFKVASKAVKKSTPKESKVDTRKPMKAMLEDKGYIYSVGLTFHPKSSEQ